MSFSTPNLQAISISYTDIGVLVRLELCHYENGTQASSPLQLRAPQGPRSIPFQIPNKPLTAAYHGGLISDVLLK